MDGLGVVTLLTAGITAGIGAFIGAYLRKKGENLATHEDIDKLLKQVSAVTATTKEIEAKISNEVWDRQKRWEIKKEAIFDFMRELGSLEVSVGNLLKACQTTKQDSGTESVRSEALDQYNNVRNSFVRARMIADVVCGKEVRAWFLMVEGTVALINTYAAQGDIGRAHDKLADFVSNIHKLIVLIRADLNLDDSSAVRSQNPATV